VTSGAEIAIDVEGLCKSFGGRQVVRDLSLQVKRGTIYGFLGPNGSGKTTTIRMLCGLLTPDAGRGSCLGFDIGAGTDEIKRRVGYMTQRFSLYHDLSVRENLEFVARIYGLAEPAAAAKATIARLGLGACSEQLAGSLSGGWKQRLALGACTLPGPQLLLLDEPTAGVDPNARREFWNEIHALAARRPDGAGLDPLHGRSRTLSRDRLYRERHAACPGHGRGRRSPLDARDLHRDRRGAFRAFSRARGRARRRHGGAVRGEPSRLGRDGEALEAAIGPFRRDPKLTWTRSSPSLEDVFIELMNGEGPPPMSALCTGPRAFWQRIGAMIIKEFLQLRRDRITFATMIAIPLVQLTLFGYAINTNPKHLPTAVLVQETSDVGRSILAALQNTRYFKITHQVDDVDALDRLLASGEILFAIEIPAGFERACGAATIRRSWLPPMRRIRSPSRSAFSALRDVVETALQNEHAIPEVPLAVRDPRASPLQPGRPRPSSISCRGCSAPS
jgi:ABC-2 type transport system ATP-binding protein